MARKRPDGSARYYAPGYHDRLRAARNALGLNLKAVEAATRELEAEARARERDKPPKVLGISQGGLSRIENGKQEPSTERLTALAQVYGVNLDWLKNGTGPRVAKAPVIVPPVNFAEPEPRTRPRAKRRRE